MRAGLVHREDGRKADLVALEELDPLVARAGEEQPRHVRLQTGPRRLVHLGRRVELDAERTEPRDQLGVELWLVARDRDPSAVSGLVHAVEVRAAVEQVRAALIGPEPHRAEADEDAHLHRRAVHHRGVDHLAAARGPALDQRGEDAEREEQPAPAEVADEVEGRDRWPACHADVREHAGERDVVDVVPGVVGERPVLSPSGHAAVHEARIARAARPRGRCRGAR